MNTASPAPSRAPIARDAVDLTVPIGGVTLKNPILTASGTFGYGLEYDDFYDVAELGGICSKGLSLEPRHGNAPSASPRPRPACSTPSAWPTSAWRPSARTTAHPAQARRGGGRQRLRHHRRRLRAPDAPPRRRGGHHRHRAQRLLSQRRQGGPGVRLRPGRRRARDRGLPRRHQAAAVGQDVARGRRAEEGRPGLPGGGRRRAHRHQHHPRPVHRRAHLEAAPGQRHRRPLRPGAEAHRHPPVWSCRAR